jgi:hypothetical protein
MIEIRKHPNVTASLHISGLGLKLPEDGSWVFISSRFSPSDIASSKDLKSAFELGLIEMRIVGDYRDAPDWFFKVYASGVRIPVEILENTEAVTLQEVHRLHSSAHPLMWCILRSGLFTAECSGNNRSAILNELM